MRRDQVVHALYTPLRCPVLLSVDMEDVPDNPALLFTPSKSISNTQDANVIQETALRTPSIPDASTRHKNMEVPRLVVEIPKLSEAELAKSQPCGSPIDTSESESEDVSKVEEIEGEHQLGNKRFLFARYGDGILRRVRIDVFVEDI